MSMVQEVPRKVWRHSAGSAWGWIMERNDNRFVRQIPNTLTVIRLVTILTAYLSYHAFYNGHMVAAWGWLVMTGVIFGGTDYLDGKSARSLDVISTFGKFVDPVADKAGIITMFILFSGAVSASMYVDTMVGIVIGAEILLLTFAFIELRSKRVPGANRWGKDKVKIEIAAVAIGSSLLFATYYGFPHWIAPLFVGVACLPVTVFALLSLSGHVNAFRDTATIPKRP